MAGRYAFSLPEPRQRDGWFKIGSLDMSTTAVVVGLGLISMVLYAINREIVFYGAFISPLVRQGEFWRLVTWPLVNPPGIFELIGLAVFWWLGHSVEDQIGRKPFATLLAAMTVIPAVIVTLFNINNVGIGWAASTSSVSLLSLGLICVFAMDRPNAPFFFGIPAWVIAAALVAMQALQLIGARAWAQLMLGALVIVIACFGAAQRGLLGEYPWIPRVKSLAGGPQSPYGEIGSARPKPKPKRFGKGRGRAKARGVSSAGSNTVVPGPWGAPTGGPTPLEQAELDVLLDRISAGGIESLTKQEKERLNALSKRMRDS